MSIEPQELQDEQLISLAFSLKSTPGSYAILLGAGVSIAGGVLSAWGVLQDLLTQLAAAKKVEHETDDERMAWFVEEYDQEPTYEHILERLAPTQHDRQAILRGYFEPTPEEQEEGSKQPTRAHQVIAELVAEGAINIVITLNFDNLMEMALRARGINPTVVRGQSDLEGLGPLHTQKALVVHLHGDYQAPSEMRNTAFELDSYTPATDAFLDRIMQDYGLVLAGWSAKYDPQLRKAMKRSFRRIYVPYWIEPGSPTEEADELREHLGAARVQATADDALGHLHDAYKALRDGAATRNPLTTAAAVGMAKRELSGRYTAIRLHDMLKRESDLLHQNSDLLQSYTGAESPNGGYPAMVNRLETASVIMAALVAAGTYWGNETTDQWWLSELESLMLAPKAGGTVAVLDLHNLVAGQLFYGAGIAAVAAGRYGTLKRLFQLQAETPGSPRGLAVQLLDPVRLYARFPSASRRLFNHLETVFVDHLTIGAKTYEDSWQRFEIIRNLAAASAHPSSGALLETIAKARDEYGKTDSEFAAAERTGDADLIQMARERRAPAWQNLDRAIGGYAALIPFRTPHLKVGLSGDHDRYVSPVVQKMARDIAVVGKDHHLLSAGIISGRPEVAAEILRAANAALHRIVVDRRPWMDSGEYWADDA